MSNKLCIAIVLGVAALLSGCGGGGGGDEGMGAASGNGSSGDPLAAVPSSASQSSNGLMAYLRSLVATTPENREPAALDGSSPPKDEVSEPAVIG
jgi:hypothetical protein